MVLAGIVLRGGSRLLRDVVDRTLHPKGATPGKKRSVTQTLVGTTLVRVATRSVPGALVVGGGLLAKTLFDRRHGKRAAGAEAAAAVDKQAEKDPSDTPDA
jgi:hypothetical protein